MCLCEFSSSLLSFFMTLSWILHLLDHNLTWRWISSWKTVVFSLWFHVTVVFHGAQWFAPLSVHLKEQFSFIGKALYTLILTIQQIANRGPSAFSFFFGVGSSFIYLFTFSFHIWYYTYFKAIIPNHPTLSLSHRVQKTVLYICVSFAVSHTGLSLPSF